MDSTRRRIGTWIVTTYYDSAGAPLRENGTHASEPLRFSGSPTAGYLVTDERAEPVGSFHSLDSLLETR